MELWQAKLLGLICLGILPLIGMLLPYKVERSFASKGKRGKRILSLLICFGGGVFFGTYLLHMSPEVHLILRDSLEVPYAIPYPVADLLIGAGFFLVFFLEQFTLTVYGKKAAAKKRKKIKKRLAAGMLNGSKDQKWMLEMPTIKEEKPESILLDKGRSCEKDIGVDQTNHVHSAQHDEQHEQASEHQHQNETDSLVLLLALSLHRAFEGMTLGLLSNVPSVFSLLVAIAMHEPIISFCLGLQLARKRTSLVRFVVTSVLYSFIMPVSVSVGMVLFEYGGESQVLYLINGVLQGIATGTFIYVTFFEILGVELSHGEVNVRKVLLIFFGFLVIAALRAIPENSPLSDETRAVISLNATNLPVLNCSQSLS